MRGARSAVFNRALFALFALLARGVAGVAGGFLIDQKLRQLSEQRQKCRWTFMLIEGFL